MVGKLWAIADLHLGHSANLEAWRLLRPHPSDALIIAGDIGERMDHLHDAFRLATQHFRQVFWAPGNHELYTLPRAGTDADPVTNPDARRGVEKYRACVAVAREHGVLTPEDDFALWDDGSPGGGAVVCPVFTLYDYSFRPPEVSRERALEWALEKDIQATDEHVLHADPYPTRDAWCLERIAATEPRLAAAAALAQAKAVPLIIANHWPLREDLIYIPLIPRFTLWCGTKATAEWHARYGAAVVVTGHLHVRRTDWRDGTRFEEVSLGYPRQWQGAKDHGMGINEMLREILPGPPRPAEGTQPGTVWRRYG